MLFVAEACSTWWQQGSRCACRVATGLRNTSSVSSAAIIRAMLMQHDGEMVAKTLELTIMKVCHGMHAGISATGGG